MTRSNACEVANSAVRRVFFFILAWLLAAPAGAADAPQVLEAGVSAPLTSIAFGTDGVGFIVGNDGSIVQVSANLELSPSVSGVSNHLLDVEVADASLAVAAGVGTVLLWNGSQWQSITSSTAATIYTGLWISPEKDLLLYGILGQFSVVCPYVPGAANQGFCRSLVAPMIRACGQSGDIKILVDSGDVFWVNNDLQNIDGGFQPLVDHSGSLGLTAAWIPPSMCVPGPIPPLEIFAIAGFNRIWRFDGAAWADTGAEIPANHVLTGISGLGADQIFVSGYVEVGGFNQAVIWVNEGQGWSQEMSLPAGTRGALDVAHQLVILGDSIFRNGFEPAQVSKVAGRFLAELLVPTESNGEVLAYDRIPKTIYDLAVSKELLTPLPLRQGDIAEFRLVVRNQGLQEATNFFFHDIFSTGMSHVGDDCASTQSVHQGPVRSIPVTVLAPGASINCTLRFMINAEPGTALTNIGSVATRGDPIYSNNRARVEFSVSQ